MAPAIRSPIRAWQVTVPFQGQLLVLYRTCKLSLQRHRRVPNRFISSMLLFAGFLQTGNANSREWVGSTRTQRFEATFVSLRLSPEGEIVTLRKPDETTIELPLEDLSTVDARYAVFAGLGGEQLLLQLSDPNPHVRRLAAKKLYTFKTLPTEAIQPILHYIESEASEMTRTYEFREPDLSAVVWIGDEISVATLSGNPAEFVGREFFIAGAILPGSQYNWSYSNAESTHELLSKVVFLKK